MTDDPQDEANDEQLTGESELERTRRLILERRNRFMAAALAGLGMTAGAEACTRASVCLSLAAQQAGSGGHGSGGAAAAGSGPDPNSCPGQPWKQPPCVCLSAPVAGSPWPQYPMAGNVAPPTNPIAGAGAGAGGTAGVAGMRPSVCLEPPVETCSNGGPPPCVCLTAPIDEDAGVDGEP